MTATAKTWDAMGDPNRRVIMEKLSRGGMGVAQIHNGMTISRPAVSQHLKVLREAKLVTMHKKGTQSLYQINAEGISSMHAYLDKLWDTALSNFKRLAEAEAKKKK
ncbi:ArsR/SmtB family transcription factor [Ferruginibacter sp.]